MTKYKNTFRIESARLKEWDYSNPWWYFVTINTKDHIPCFGKIDQGRMLLNDFGKMVETQWKNTKTLRQMVDLDYYVIMPNHIHGIIIINGTEVETHRVRLGNDPMRPGNNRICFDAGQKFLLDHPKDADTQFEPPARIIRNCLCDIIKGFKSSVTKFAHENGINDFFWQSRFYDRIIRNEKELFNIRRYIDQNPLKWEFKNQ